MAWHSLCIVLWATSACASLLPFKDKSYPQSPLGDPPANPLCGQETKVVPADEALPTVNLGYTKHKAVKSFNEDLYKFQNIRYAAPPTGDLRFRAPRPPLRAPADEVEDGSGRKECLQATIKWAENFPEDPCASSKFCECCRDEVDSGTCYEPCTSKDSKPLWGSRKRLLGGLIPSPDLKDPNLYSEDCLFLDVWIPKFALDDIGEVFPLPVVVWIYGGAYIFGGKSLYFPGGLMDRSLKQGRGGVIFVAMNYRMGALGFAAGKDIDDEDINAGLLDQQQALLWVKEHIGKFGGDPDQVTIAGLSAGGGSVLHHLTAYGRKETSLFKRAISLSGGWQPVTNRETAEATFQDFMKLHEDVSTLDELRQVSEEQMMQANFDHIASAPPGTFLYNPTAWGNFTPESPSKLFQKGNFAQDVEIILSNVYDEGGQFIGAFKEKGTTVPEFVNFALPDVTRAERQWIYETYITGNDSADIAKIIGDVTFRCHATYVSDAKNKEVWRHRWNTVKSNGHGGDLLYLFYQPLVPVHSIRSARILQDYVVTFALYGENPTTMVKNPYPIPQPAFYEKHATDDKVQYFDSGFLAFPHLWRGPTESDDVCRQWQKMAST